MTEAQVRPLQHPHFPMILSKIRQFSSILLIPLLMAAPVLSRAQDETPGHLRTQEIPLKKGWNAVYLEVEPLDATPAAVFAGVPVDKAAALFKNPGNQQFVTDPDVNLSKGQGWGVWYSTELPEAFLKSLDAINGNRAYLVHAKSDFQWRATGRVTGAPVAWQPDAFNFTGASVAAIGGPTFAQYFAGSTALKNQTIYRMVNGRWKQVIQPSAESMRSGEAFWIFCKGSSDYQGPLRVEATGQGLALGRGPAELTIRNEAPHPLTPTLQHVPGDASPLPRALLLCEGGAEGEKECFALPLVEGEPPAEGDCEPLAEGDALPDMEAHCVALAVTVAEGEAQGVGVFAGEHVELPEAVALGLGDSDGDAEAEPVAHVEPVPAGEELKEGEPEGL